jgi:uncharacterized protein with PQ loop repeat
MAFSDEDDSKSNVTDLAVDVVVGLVICAGIVASYIPQHVACWKARSAEGLSLSTLNFCALSMTTRLLATYLGDHGTIATGSGMLEKFDRSMPTLQAAITVLFTYPYLVYYFTWGTAPRLPEQIQTPLMDNGVNDGIDDMPGIAVTPLPLPSALPETTETTTMTSSNSSDTRRYAQIVSTVVMLVVVAVATGASVIALARQDLSQQQSQIELWGGVATLTNAIMWIPQIMETWRLQHGGVLSVAALLFSAVGDFVLGAYWVAKGENVWIWGSLVADSSMQMILIGMVLYYRRRDSSNIAPTYDLLENGDVPEYDLVLENGDVPETNAGEPEGPSVEL